jgi:hypothetical protein
MRSQAVQAVRLLAKRLMPFWHQKTSFYWIDRDQRTCEPELEGLFGMLEKGEIEVLIKRVWGLEEVPRAHRSGIRVVG